MRIYGEQQTVIRLLRSAGLKRRLDYFGLRSPGNGTMRGYRASSDHNQSLRSLISHQIGARLLITNRTDPFDNRRHRVAHSHSFVPSQEEGCMQIGRSVPLGQ